MTARGSRTAAASGTRRDFRRGLLALLAAVLTTSMGATMQTVVPSRGITAVSGLKAGHHTLQGRPTGCTVIIAEAGAVAGVDVRGAAPATRETELLRPTNTVQHVHAIVLSGGSAYGLDTAGGVMRFLEERTIGFPIGGGVVPIVPAAALFDLRDDRAIRPGADCGYAAARAASTAPLAEGTIGAGAGATVGKLVPGARPMKGGLGTSAIELPNGLVVAALVAVNAIGNVVDPLTGHYIAGARTADGASFVDLRAWLRRPVAAPPLLPLESTTLGIVATNARLTKVEATRIAERAHDGYARAIYPSHLSLDGDVIFALSTGTHTGGANLDHIGSLAADAMADAIVRAVRAATGIPGYPAVRDLRP